ncbi:hypothetical protein RO3G_04970 [Rhizopus delemar RA 99-880]|uniref:Uncharacterized protein n=1 Tax=Rhizopus delemar (strain RA 99-880 / ATCC MYA-4621 / FGSC 9543 / NRRL 43880) TaxID=246409 RepID=I1BVN5_RHIO9|nr:hypothetical protein RO3G_04970 [Rhizopus delemar RA 99-880]|eukprot:EIE80265.1 hypothetical protein RO3G_04970 [Rhizopus delemar RA 99-880]
MSIQALGVFLMVKEQRVVVPVDFKEKDISMIPFIQFYLPLAVCGRCRKSGREESLKAIQQLKEEHKVAVNAVAANRNQDC